MFPDSQITADGDCSHAIKRCLLLGRKVMTNLVQFNSVAQLCLTLCDPMDCSTPGLLWQHIKKQRHCFANRGPPSQSYGFPSSHVWMWEFGYKENWALKNWCSWIVVLEKTLESRLDCEEIQPVPPQGNQSWIFIGRTDAKAETPILWLPDEKNWLIGKAPDNGKDWGLEEKGTTEAGWLDGWLVSSGSWWWSGKPGVLQSMGWQRVRHDWTELIPMVIKQYVAFASVICFHYSR